MKILAIADTHISDTMSLGGTHPMEGAEPRVLAQGRRMLGWFANLAAELEPDLIVHAGDLYDSPRPGPAVESVVTEALIMLSEVAPVVLLVGNHDRPQGTGVHACEPLKHVAPGRLFVADMPDPIYFFEDRYLQPQQWLAGAPSPNRSPRAVIYPIPYPARAGVAVSSSSPEMAMGTASTALDQILRRADGNKRLKA